ncbi:hypothetical protein AOQ84DRAFT_104912 [Glonium stellatum]|uniref:Ankyrin repeat protein n=1 Tax=Glonium stellatum TaxID=574774 RepID=A0A8E2FAU8_9PEZI|nr:hypothetical protein AOQ84DRAFT_104912 [Glonium stellatum]
MASSPPAPTIDALLNAVPDHPATVLAHLSRHPHLASAQDSHGYSLLHAAASYSHAALLRALVRTYAVAPDLVDEDGETALFVCETVEVARCLVEELGASVGWRNREGKTAEERVEEEAEFVPVAAYLRQVMARGAEGADAGAAAGAGAGAGAEDAAADEVHHPPPLPNGIKINMGTIGEEEVGEAAPDPEFRRRIEELAAREDFQGEEGQRQLRELVTEAVTGLAADQQGREVRRRVE